MAWGKTLVTSLSNFIYQQKVLHAFLHMSTIVQLAFCSSHNLFLRELVDRGGDLLAICMVQFLAVLN